MFSRAKRIYPTRPGVTLLSLSLEPWKTARDLMKVGFETGKCWRDRWTQSNVPNSNPVPDPSQGVMGMDLP